MIKRYTPKALALALSLCSLGSLSSCDGWINDATTPKNTLTREQLNSPNLLYSVRSKALVDGPLVAYIKTLAGQATSSANLVVGTLSDELAAGVTPNAKLYQEIANDAVLPNSSVDGVWNVLHNLRARAEEALEIEASLTAGDPAARAATRYTANLYAGYAYVLLANTFSDVPSEAGRVRVKGNMLSHSELVNTAIKHYEAAIEASKSSALAGYESSFDATKATRIAEAMLTKLYVQAGRYDSAAQHFARAYASGDRLEIVYGLSGGDNGFFSVLNAQLRDVQISPSLVAALSNEAERKALPVAQARNKNNYLSAITRTSPITLVDDSELLLIKAELILRGHLSGSALEAVNAVIARYDASSVEVTEPTLERLAHLRRVYLALRGERTLDYRRGLVTSPSWAARKNKWLPMPELER